MPTDNEVAGFIRGSFRSVWSLELLCLLRREPRRDWPHEEMVSALRASDLVVRHSLDSLVAAGLVVVEHGGSARYQPVSPQVDDLVEGAQHLYAKRPDKVRRMIVGATATDLSAFADSFKLRKD
jgi:DNA-binding FadR family transcriptional regulator